MDPDFKEKATERLLSQEENKKSDAGDDFQSCNSGDEEPKNNIEGPFNGSLNSQDINRFAKSGTINGNGNPLEEDDSHEEQKLSQRHIPTKSSMKAQTMMNRRKKKVAKKRTLLDEIKDLLVFCYEFLLIMAVLASGSILASIPVSLYVIISLLYLGLQIIIENKKMSNNVCMILMGVMLVISIAFLIFKIIFAILINGGTIATDETLHRSLGIAVHSGNEGFAFWLITQTFLADVVSLLVSLLLLIG